MTHEQERDELQAPTKTDSITLTARWNRHIKRKAVIFFEDDTWHIWQYTMTLPNEEPYKLKRDDFRDGLSVAVAWVGGKIS